MASAITSQGQPVSSDVKSTRHHNTMNRIENTYLFNTDTTQLQQHIVKEKNNIYVLIRVYI